jgi:cell wall-associated NlpC family hydrolase
MTGTRHPLAGHPDAREVAVPVATVWTSPDAPRDVDRPAVLDMPDVASWTTTMDRTARLGLHGRTLTQLLLGEPALVLEERDGWSKVAGLWQESSGHAEGYPGWIRTAHLTAPVDRTAGPTAFVVAPTTTCRTDDGAVLEVSCGTALWLDDSDSTTAPGADDLAVLLPGGGRGTLPRSDVRRSRKDEPASWSPADLLGTARQFLGLPYLWGGTSAWGLDCSGLVHLTFRAHGRRVPRDASDQAVSGRLEPVRLDEVRPGDLYFFARPGQSVYHVGFVTRPVEADGTRWMLHAPEGTTTVAVIEDAPMAADRVEKLVSAGRFVPPS